MKRLSKDDIKKVASDNPNGFTIDEWGNHYDRNGYAVALRPLTNLPPQTKYIGGWSHKGKYYLDEVEIFRGLGHALRTAIKHNQKAIWDFNFKREIVITDIHRKLYGQTIASDINLALDSHQTPEDEYPMDDVKSNPNGKTVFRAFDIVFDTEGIDVDELSDEYFFEVEDENFEPSLELADLISDASGWFVERFKYEVVKPALNQLIYAISEEKANKHNKVREIRLAHQNGATNKELAEKYQMGRSTISDIVNFKTWKDI